MADIFALRDSSLNAFLFSDVGMEPNGTSLTILSLLARLGKDPWAEAAAWSLQPRDAAIKSLADSISLIPPNPQALADAHLTASRLVALLPGHGATRDAANSPASWASILIANWTICLYLSLLLVFGFWLTAGPNSKTSASLAFGPLAASTK